MKHFQQLGLALQQCISDAIGRLRRRFLNFLDSQDLIYRFPYAQFQLGQFQGCKDQTSSDNDVVIETVRLEYSDVSRSPKMAYWELLLLLHRYVQDGHTQNPSERDGPLCLSSGVGSTEDPRCETLCEAN